MRRARRPPALLPLIVWCALSGAPGAAEPGGAGPGGVTARLVAPAGAITVGDPVVLKLTVTRPPGASFDYPDAARLSALADQEAGAAVATGPPPPSLLVEEVRPVEAKPPRPGETSWSIRVRPFVPGDLALPPLALTYRLPGSSETHTVSSTPLTIRVTSVLQGPEEAPADIKGPWRIPPAWWPFILAAAAALLLLALLAAWRRRSRSRRAPAPAPAPPAAPQEPPYERALRELERLLASGLLGQGRIKDFHVILSEIVKRFLGEQRRFDALDRTTWEVLGDLTKLGADRSVLDATGRFLGACDLVKFAKHRPDGPEIDATVAAARALIETGRPPRREAPEGVAA